MKKDKPNATEQKSWLDVIITDERRFKNKEILISGNTDFKNKKLKSNNA